MNGGILQGKRKQQLKRNVILFCQVFKAYFECQSMFFTDCILIYIIYLYHFAKSFCMVFSVNLSPTIWAKIVPATFLESACIA